MKEKEIPSGENCLGLLVVKNRIKMKEHTILPFRQKKRLSFFFFNNTNTSKCARG